MGGSYSGSTTVSKTVSVGSIPTPPANKGPHRDVGIFVRNKKAPEGAIEG
jgi:hypothetical protein